jgi:creatinine amidohydrolase
MSFVVQLEIMIELMLDVFKSLTRDGLKKVCCVTGHGEALHNSCIYQGVLRGVSETGLDISFAAEDGLFSRLKIDLGGARVGQGETSQMLALWPELVKETKLADLDPVAISMADLVEWRQGSDVS